MIEACDGLEWEQNDGGVVFILVEVLNDFRIATTTPLLGFARSIGWKSLFSF